MFNFLESVNTFLFYRGHKTSKNGEFILVEAAAAARERKEQVDFLLNRAQCQILNVYLKWRFLFSYAKFNFRASLYFMFFDAMPPYFP